MDKYQDHGGLGYGGKSPEDDYSDNRIAELEAAIEGHVQDNKVADTRIAELELENKALRLMLSATPDTFISSGAAQAMMAYEIDLRKRTIEQLEEENYRLWEENRQLLKG